MEREGQRARRSGISRRGARVVAALTGYVCLMFAIGTPLVAPLADLAAGTALTLAELLFAGGVAASVFAYVSTRRTPWRPALASALTLVPLPAGLLSLWLWVIAR